MPKATIAAGKESTSQIYNLVADRCIIRRRFARRVTRRIVIREQTSSDDEPVDVLLKPKYTLVPLLASKKKKKKGQRLQD